MTVQTARPAWLHIGHKPTQHIMRAVGFVLLLGGLIIIMLPIVWMVTSAFSSFEQIVRFPPSLIPNPWVWNNFSDAATSIPFGRYYLNSVQIAALRVIGGVASASLAGYAFARLRSPTREPLFILVLSTMMLPYAVTMIPQFVLFKTLGWIDSYRPLIVPSFFGGTPFLIFLFRQFFRTIPEEIFEAARLDGCGYFAAYWHILLPLSAPVIATACILMFEISWDDFLGPLIYINSNIKYTLPLGLASMKSAYGAPPWHHIMALALLTALPPIILFFAAQRWVISGIVVTSK